MHLQISGVLFCAAMSSTALNSASVRPRGQTVRGLSAGLDISNDPTANQLPAVKRQHYARNLSSRLSTAEAYHDADDVGIYSNRVSEVFSSVTFPCGLNCREQSVETGMNAGYVLLVGTNDMSCYVLKPLICNNADSFKFE